MSTILQCFGSDGHVGINGSECAQTEHAHGLWWMVDLGGQFKVQKVVITNRGNCNCGELFDLKTQY